MSTYSSKPVVVNQAASEIAHKLSDFSGMQAKLDELSPEDRAKVGEVSFESDAIRLVTPQVGAIVMRVAERTPGRLVLNAEGSPMPMKLIVDYKEVSADSTEIVGAIDINLPALLRPMVGPALQKAADQLGTLFARLA